jgi:potassium/hydrogen antiporter
VNLSIFFGVMGGLLVLAFVANRLARRTGVPDVLVLMATGLLIGPIFHLVDATRFEPYTQVFGTLALILILFEAGLELDLSETLSHFGSSLFLALATFGVTTLGIAVLCKYALEIPRIEAYLVGSVIGCMSSAVVIPVLKQLPLRRAVGVTLTVEASFGDALGALTTGVLLGIAVGPLAGGESTPVSALLSKLGLSSGAHALSGGLVGSFFLHILVAAIMGGLLGLAWTRLLPFLAEQNFWHVLTLAATLLLYSATKAAGGSELFAVMVFGFMLANFPRHGGAIASAIDKRAAAQHRMLSFHSELGFLIRTFFFVIIGVITNLHGIRRFILETLGILAVIFLVRILVVQASRLVWRGIDRGERELAYYLTPRGLINAVLAIEVVKALPDMKFLPALAFGAILSTNILMLVGTMRGRKLLPAPSESGEFATIPSGEAAPAVIESAAGHAAPEPAAATDEIAPETSA